MKNKEYSESFLCASKCIHALMKYMKSMGGSVESKELKTLLPTLVSFSDWEKELTDKENNVRWWAILQFSSVSYVKSGYIVKSKGKWFLTPEADKLLAMSAEKAHETAVSEYRAWKAKYRNDEGASEDEEELVEESDSINLDELESQAKSTIREAMNRKNPYEFQDMVAALLRSMGYYTPFIAPKGKDGGVDVIAYQDPLGAKAPRLKVQVKHKPESAVPANDVRALRGVLGADDVGVFVTSGTYSPDAKKEGAGGKFIRLIDGDEFIDMWQTYYDKLTDEDKNMLPLKRIAFLGSNE